MNTPATEPPEIVVVGSANLDIVVPVPHHPRPGETVLGGDHRQVPGGKGANQATAAARLGRRVAFVGCVGADPAGQVLLDSLREAGVNVDAVSVIPDAPSGIATISVSDDGENAIVVSPGANAHLTAEVVRLHSDLIASAAVVLLQLETPLDGVTAAAKAATGRVLLNPAPARQLPPELLNAVDVVLPNRTELAVLAGTPDELEDETIEQQVRDLGVPIAIITLGAAGALLHQGDESRAVPTPSVTPVDTTGAGDAFCAGLADGLLTHDALLPAVHWAVRVGAATTLRPGAAPSLPTRDEVATLLGDQP